MATPVGFDTLRDGNGNYFTDQTSKYEINTNLVNPLRPAKDNDEKEVSE